MSDVKEKRMKTHPQRCTHKELTRNAARDFIPERYANHIIWYYFMILLFIFLCFLVFIGLGEFSGAVVYYSIFINK